TLFVPEAAVVLRGLLLGDRTNIDQGITDNFARSGVIHILAVSGLHVGFVMAFCVMIGWLIRLKERELIILTLCVIWAYALITGVKPPVVRASAMASIFIIGRYRDKPINGGNLLAFAAILLLIFRPEEIFQAGFQLSFAAVAGILLLFPKIDHFFKSVCWIDKLYRYRIGRWIFGLMAVSFAAQIATLPFSAYHFGRVSFVGVFANLVVIPAIFITVISSVISLALLPLSMSLAQLLGAIPNGIVLFIIWLTDNIAGMSFSGLENWYPPIWVLLLYITVILALLYWQNMAIRFSTIAVVLALLNVAVWENIITGGPKLKATFLNVGQGDASFIQTPSGQNILIDAGRATPDYDAGKEVILPFFERHGIEKLDLVFITHPHFDHFGGLPAILKAMPVSKVAFVDTAYKSKSFRKLLDILQIEGVPIHIAKRGQIIDDFSPVQIWISGPALEYAKQNNRPNESSLTLQICYGKNVLLFMGDTQWRGEERMLPYGNLLSSEILKVGHHGSRTSSTAPCLDFVKPNYAVISVGAFNRFKHPSFAVTSRLAAIECDTLRTDLSGALVFTSDGRTIERVK
ncbi:MAG: DNA internalization-related competence protein ComEC/Rec2, partial [bacterium]